MVALIGILSMLCGLGFLVCWIMVIIAAFKKEESPLLGILCIVLCSLGAFIIGWIKHAQWGIKQLMLIWTGLWVAIFVLQILAVMFGASQVEIN